MKVRYDMCREEGHDIANLDVDGIFQESDPAQTAPSVSQHHGRRVLYFCTPVPILSVLIYLLLWVANAEMMQGVASGSLAPEPFDRPAFLSWFSYNFMLLSWIPLTWYCRNVINCTIWEYIQTSWAGPSGLRYMLLCSLSMQVMLLALNMLWIVGLGHISVTVSNAVYQLQAAVTLGLSVCFLGNETRFSGAESIGILISLAGVCLIVIPPLLEQSVESDSGGNDKDVILGLITTLMSAVIWAMYQVAWRFIVKDKPEMSRREGLMDSVATLAVMGLCNVGLGWMVLLVAHVIGVEPFEPPPLYLIPALARNGLVESSFDVSIAVAIFLTSPVITAITAPLTIPIALVWDHFLYGSPFQVGSFDWIGSLLVLVGVVFMELKLSLPCFPRKIANDTYQIMLEKDFVIV